MPKFYNIIPGKESDAILLYGYIGNFDECTPRDIVAEIMMATYSGRKIDVRINSDGGEVDAGIAIFNALRNSDADITIYIDGIAASIASVIAACGKKVEMSKYARLMVHSVQGGGYGTKDDLKRIADECINLENTLAEIYAKRMGITPEEVKTKYFDGEEHWFTADEALRLGLVDSIYDTEPIDMNMPPKQVYEYYLNKFKNQFSNKTDEKMNEVKKRFGLPETATEADVLSKITELEGRAGVVTEKDATITELTNKLQTYQQKETADNEAAIVAIVDKAIADNKIIDTQKGHYISILKADRANGEAIINSLQPMKRAIDYTKGEKSEESPWAKRQREIEENANKRKNR